MDLQPTLAYAQQADRDSSFASLRSQFIIPQHNGVDATYFLGNSLGLQPKRTQGAIRLVLDQWSNLGVEAFFKGEEPWIQFHKKLTPTLGKIVGALPHEVVVMNSLTVNLHLMLVSFYKPVGKRTKIICEAKAFPSDQYMLFTHVQQRGLNPEETIIEVAPREDEVLIREEDIVAAIEQHRDELALFFWGGVNYYTGQVFNMATLTQAAHAVGAKVGYDLAHAVGNIPLQLHNWDVDFACWCSYKYLNSGPGAVGGAYVHERYHNDDTLDRFAGWWGNKKETQFLMEKAFVPEASAEGWQLSTPSPMLYAAHLASLDVFAAVGPEAVFQENKRLTAFLWSVLNDVIAGVPAGSLRIFTPEKSGERGCQVSLAVKHGKKVFDVLSEHGVFADWREPDVIRVAPVSLYNTHEEVWRFGQILKEAILTFAA